ncbi:MAG: DNA repair exonuclease [Chloroflexi bacterium]|nr:DNA repair exonuclease [Chloroflexota bacterium]MBM4449810.1 DNA repair exonuclease [Chloroflexota bacterium]
MAYLYQEPSKTAMIKLLHTADIHLGREFPLLGEKGKEYRNQLVTTFDKIIDLAIKENVSLLLIAGDLFDTNRVHGIVVAKVLSAFRKLEERGVPICILPGTGTHDSYGEDSIYRFVRFPPNVVVFTPRQERQTYSALGLTVYGKVFSHESASENPFRGLSLVRDSEFHIGMAHCSVKIEGLIDKDEMILDMSEIAGSGLDYLALGHWHGFKEFTAGNTRVAYSGAPEPIYMNQKEAGSVNLVTMPEKGKANVAPVRVGSKQFDEMTIDVGPVKSIDDIVDTIQAKGNPDLILKVTLFGLCSMDLDLNGQEIEERLGGQFFCLRVVDKWHPKLDEVANKNFPEETVIGRFMKSMRDKIAASTDEQDKALYEEALKLGYALLHGRSQVIE